MVTDPAAGHYAPSRSGSSDYPPGPRRGGPPVSNRGATEPRPSTRRDRVRPALYRLGGAARGGKRDHPRPGRPRRPMTLLTLRGSKLGGWDSNPQRLG